MSTQDKIRECRFQPYLSGRGPCFSLYMWDTGKTDSRGCTTIGYQLRCEGRTIFRGEDFNASPLHAIDSDACVASLMGFLTLRPGDTDSEYFDSYQPHQVEFCEQHAEALSCEVLNRFGEDY